MFGFVTALGFYYCIDHIWAIWLIILLSLRGMPSRFFFCSVLCGIPPSLSSFIASGFNPDIGSMSRLCALLFCAPTWQLSEREFSSLGSALAVNTASLCFLSSPRGCFREPLSAFRMSAALWIIRILQPPPPPYANFSYSFAKIYPRNEVYLLCASNAVLYSAFCSGVSALIAA